MEINIKEKYQSLYSINRERVSKLKRQGVILGYSRLTIAIAVIYLFYKFINGAGTTSNVILLLLSILFLILVRIHYKCTGKRRYFSILMDLNRDEINAVEGKETSTYDGEEFLDSNHPYTNDLNIFGESSIYKYINRTASYFGRVQLAKLFKSIKKPDEIIANQKAVIELRDQIGWRQRLSALLMIKRDSKESVDALLTWGTSKEIKGSRYMHYLAFIFPILFIISIVLCFITKESYFISSSILIYLINMAILASQFSAISKEINGSSKIEGIIKSYSLAVKHIEDREFNTERLKELQRVIKGGKDAASTSANTDSSASSPETSSASTSSASTSTVIKQLSKHLGALDSISNLLIVMVLDGCFLYHIHALHSMRKWREKHGEDISDWLTAVGEIETLSSVANYSYNNSNYTFPTLNDKREITFTDIGHPLIDSSVRVCSSIEFTSHKFTILTGSNMSGKSTFLRSIGLNMVLAGAGAPVCAKEANIHPLDIFVSMKVSDSLAENTSYFFAEIKRLKQALQFIEGHDTLILLDEILRGTNSDDKREGTIKLIEQLVKREAIGAVATHDLEVCHTTDNYPDYLINRCFEVEVRDDNLYFDYTLKDGICQNKNALFLMKKEGIITS